MTKPLLVAEDLGARRSLFRAFGVTWWATRYAWLSPFSWASLATVMALVDQQAGGARLPAALEYWAILYAANVVHSLGHVVAGRLARAPVQGILLTSTRDVVVYVQPGAAAPARRRLGRALGGPLANLAVGCAAFLAGRSAQTGWLVTVGVINLGVAIWTLMPVPSLDGWVIWKVLGRSRSDHA